MRRYTLSPQFIRDFLALESGMSRADEEIFDALLASVISEPRGVEKVQTFYDPHHPSWLGRSAPFVVHFAFDSEADEVVFLNLFRRR